MIEHWRSSLYYLGFIASLLFGIRILLQWFQSERKKESSVTQAFWWISLSANVIMTTHSFIQLQYPICMIQALNGLIAWRNLRLMRTSPPSPLRKMLILSGISLSLITFLFLLQGFFLDSFDWMRAPSLPWKKHSDALDVSWMWHLFGQLGLLLFASRFWLQWWEAERRQKSVLGKSFWWTSLIGSSLAFLYFIRLHDFVNILSYGMGLIPYVRNLVLMGKVSKKTSPPLRKNSLFIFAGEQSGDLLGGTLAAALKKARPSLHLYGVAGKHMREAGVDPFLAMEQFQVMGITAVIGAFPRLWNNFQKIKNHILSEPPEAVILIDYPDFNMRLEKALRKRGYQGKLIHYVSPTIWAWRASRAETLAQTLDHLLTIFPFEKTYFEHTPLPVTYVGHPLAASIENYSYNSSWKEKYGLPQANAILALFPGSRFHEIQHNLPAQLKAAESFCEKHPATTIAISVARPELLPSIKEIQNRTSLSTFLVPQENRYELMKESQLALATSGTITLELALHETPTVVTYQVGGLNYLLGKYLFRIRLDHFCIVNIIQKKTVFPEFVQRKLSSSSVTAALHQLLDQQETCRSECRKVIGLLKKEEDASHTAAKAILQIIQ